MQHSKAARLLREEMQHSPQDSQQAAVQRQQEPVRQERQLLPGGMQVQHLHEARLLGQRHGEQLPGRPPERHQEAHFPAQPLTMDL